MQPEPEPGPEPQPEGAEQEAEPGAVWRNGAFAGEFGDAFIAETDLEGGHSGPAIGQLLTVVRAVLKARLGECSLLEDEARAVTSATRIVGFCGFYFVFQCF